MSLGTRIKTRGDGREKLIEAALLEFEEHGFDGTNSNAIAQRAGYAPQTFYRHFADKRDIFLAVYKNWADAEMLDLSSVCTVESAVDVLLHHHRTHRIFRRSLRALTVTDPQVSAARAQARLEQVRLLAMHNARTGTASLIAGILKLERLCDAVADGEFAACGIDDQKARELIISELRSLLPASAA